METNANTPENEYAEGLNKIARYGLAVGLANPAADAGPDKVKRFDGIFKKAMDVKEVRLKKIAGVVLENFGTKAPATQAA